MLELMLILGLVVLGGAVLIAVAAFAVKVVFKLVLLPFVLALFLIKVIGALMLIVLFLAVAPVLLAVLLVVAVPLLLVAGVFGLGALAFSAA